MTNRKLSMQERVELERMGRDPHTITELFLDNCHSYVIEGVTSEYTALRSLSINYAMVQNFRNLPCLPSLEVLSAHHNLVKRNLQFLADRCPNLKEIDLAYNHLSDVEELRPLAKLKQLEKLELYHNKVNHPCFRKEIFQMLPSLKLLSGIEKTKYKRRAKRCEPNAFEQLEQQVSGLELLEATGEEKNSTADDQPGTSASFARSSASFTGNEIIEIEIESDTKTDTETDTD